MCGESKEKSVTYQMRLGKLGNRLKTPFEIQIVEHVYDGSPRWREKDVSDSYQVHTRDTTSPAAREPAVRWAIDNAWGRESPGQSGSSVQGEFGQGLYDLMTCTNAACEERTQMVVHGGAHLHSGEAPCSKCGKPLSLIHCRPLEKKWLYVLSGGEMTLTHEIYAKDEYEWLVLRNLPKRIDAKWPSLAGAYGSA